MVKALIYLTITLVRCYLHLQNQTVLVLTTYVQKACEVEAGSRRSGKGECEPQK